MNDLLHPAPERLSEYLDGELGDRERAQVATHLEGCGECAGALDQLRAVKVRAASLPARGPETDLWPAIEGRLEPRGATAGGRATIPNPVRGWRDWRVSLGLPQLAAAALALVLLGAGGLWVALERTRLATPAATTVDRTAPGFVGPTALPADFGFVRYDGAIAALRQTLENHRSELDSTTVRIVDHNLLVIDHAIAEARRALAADPANPYLNHHLADQMQRKVNLLRQVTALIHA